ncbi:MAG: carboxypeptidase-like regulatory domain-containing protein, partial [Bacteroides sp.]|nr:carboxypeptidase-like regulatory domain-containing protein [Bacteroides sp.]
MDRISGKSVKAVVASFLFTSLLCAQEKPGRVYDRQTGEPISGVHVYLTNEEIVAVTDTNGIFLLTALPEAQDSLILSFSHISYERQEVLWEEFVDHGREIYLYPSAQVLHEVSVPGRRLQLQLTHRTLAPLPIAVHSFAAALADNCIYVVGGEMDFAYNDKIYKYDISQDGWETLPHQLHQRVNHTVNHYKGRLYITGGTTRSVNRRKTYLDHTVEIYNLQRDTVWVDPVNPHQAVRAASCIYDPYLVLLGGSIRKSHSGKFYYTDKVHALDLERGFWYEMKSLPDGLAARGICIGEKLYMIGGTSQEKEMDRISSYHMIDGSVVEEAKLAYPVVSPAVAAENDMIYIFEKDLIQTFHIKTGEVQVYQTWLYINYCEMFCAGGKLYIIGGLAGQEDIDPDFRVFILPTPSRSLYCIDLEEFDCTAQHYT